jgi:hypothetical protein
VKGWRILPGDSWMIPLRSGDALYCIAATADRQTGAATVVTELR